MSYLPCIELEPADSADAAVIWLHGLGASGHDFEAIVPELKLPPDHRIRFIFPHAPSIPITINGGFVMPAWYDIMDMDIERKVDKQQLQTSADALNALIEREIARGIDSRRIVIAGFSQGGAVAYQSALSFTKPLAGLLALSTYFATASSITPSDANKDLTVYIFHGSNDPMVAESQGQMAYKTLLTMGYKAEYKNYPMEHAVCPAEIDDIANCLKLLLR